MLGVRHRLRSCGELLDILLALMKRWLSLDAARLVALGPRQARLGCLFQVLASTLDFH